MFSFQELKELEFNPLSDNDERKIYNSLEKSGQELFKIFDNIKFDTCYKLTSNSKNILNGYKTELCKLHNSEQNPLLQKEINSRELKALKLSCLYACINHSQVLEIQEEDIEQAIDTVEYLSKDFKKFLHYHPKTGDKYDKAYEFLRENEGIEFTKTEILRVFTSQFGFSREPLRHNFEEVMTTIHEIAQADDYSVVCYDNKYGNGTYLSLVKNEFAIATTVHQKTMSISTKYPL